MRVFSVESFWLPLIVVTALSVLFSMALSRRRADLHKLRLEESALLEQLKGLRTENERLRAERDALLTSASQIERVAREDYGFRGPGELVSRFEDRPTTEKKRTLPSGNVWEKILRNGEFPWAIPLSVFGLSAVVFALMNRILLAGARADATPERSEAGASWTQ